MNNTFFLVVGLIAGIFLAKLLTCNRPEPCPEYQATTTITTDTAKKEVPKQASDWHKPVPKTEKADKPVTNAPEKADTGRVDVVKDYYVRRDYADTFRFAEGNVIVQNSVSENKIQQQRAILDSFKKLVITNTVTNSVVEQERKRIKAYYSLILQGSQNNPLQAAGVGFMLQFKNDNAVEVDALYNRQPLFPNQDRLQFQASYKGKISFRR